MECRKGQTHVTSDQRKLIEQTMTRAKTEFEANNGSLTPICFVVHPGGIEATPCPWRDRSEKYATYEQLSRIAGERSAEAVLLVTDVWIAKVDPRNDEHLTLPPRYRSDRTEAINAYLIAPDGLVIANGLWPYLRSGAQILWGELEISEPNPSKRERHHQFMIPPWDKF